MSSDSESRYRPGDDLPGSADPSDVVSGGTEPGDIGPGYAEPSDVGSGYAEPGDIPPRYGTGWASWPPAEPKSRADRWSVKALVGLATAVVIALLGFPLGWLWSTVAPWLPVVVGDGGLYYADPEGEQRAAQEGWFVLLSIGLGAVLAIVVWIVLRRYRGVVMLAALAIGGGGAGVLAWRFGHNIGRGHAFAVAKTAANGTVIKFPVDLRIKRLGLWHGLLPYVGGDLLYVAIAATLTYLLLAGFALSPSLGTRPSSPAFPLPPLPVDSDPIYQEEST